MDEHCERFRFGLTGAAARAIPYGSFSHLVQREQASLFGLFGQQFAGEDVLHGIGIDVGVDLAIDDDIRTISVAFAALPAED